MANANSHFIHHRCANSTGNTARSRHPSNLFVKRIKWKINLLINLELEENEWMNLEEEFICPFPAR
jgi:hypothetical protein